jgi:CheY-like chemotaxis protein
MSSIALFNSSFTKEMEIREKLALASGYEIVQDIDLIDETSRVLKIEKEKILRAMYKPTSVFNQFTHERERALACLKIVMAGYLKSTGIIFSGYITHLIPAAVTHVLKVGIFDDRGNRIQRAVKEGLAENKAKKIIKNNDMKAFDWTDFVLDKIPTDSSLYDIVVPVGPNSPEYIVQLILENYNKPAVLESDASVQAIEDLELAGRVELELNNKGYNTEVGCSNGCITLFVNKSVISFKKLTEKLTKVVEVIDGVKRVDVVTGKDYHLSVYRDQEFVLPPKVLLVDDEEDFVQTLADRLNTREYGSYPVFSGEQALDFIDHETPDVMVLDLKMPGIHGVDVLQKTKAVKPEIEIIILTGHGSEDDKKTCMEQGAYAYLQKPVEITQLTKVIDEAYKKVAADKLART